MAENRLQLAGLFKRFAQAAQEQGAEHVAHHACRGRTLEHGATTQACGGESLFDLPVGRVKAFKKQDPARICVVCDKGYDFPRYQ